MNKDLLLSSYDYTLANELIANYPANPKEDARLLVFDRKNKEIFHTTFKNLKDFLPDCAIFFNDTKVIKARIYGNKASGGKIELFLHQPFLNSHNPLFLAQIKGRVKKDEILYFKEDLKARVVELLDDGLRKVQFFQNDKTLDTSNEIIDSKQAILGVGTTVTRTIEYYARTKTKSGFCDLFLHPQNPPIRQNHLLTNFHLPKSTLIMLVSAFIGREQCLKLYELAIKEKYRFYSYGDAMLIL
ncbi:S-adenosylmethionine:tRNA ribosyltransferase-isomerase [Campylobacter jejuni]|uniref:S-adenosylmethionine:tRNA ribosyltransferase-isomerase n=1 Tax=Campylobacter jejuni TaxID=197 RepID=UPI00073E001A|nr:S-adenosylmethionine:tRNA ribosyltransferase-isomerase [Campylobacter jejuni]ALW33385.1 S-adenosylmethionine tRNA ribosyltransferase [Campylobacter jejuni]